MTIYWKAEWKGDSGYINGSKSYIKMLEDSEHEIRKLSFMDLHSGKIKAPKLRKEDIVVANQIPDVLPNEEFYFSVVEFNVPPPKWWPSLENSKVIMTQSEFCKDIFARTPGINSDKFHIVHVPINRQVFKPQGDKYETELIENADFVFGSVFDWCARKQPERQWLAFMREFPLEEYPDMLFLNKISTRRNFTDWKYKFNRITKGDPRIKIINKNIPDMGKFYRSLDAYVLCSAGEGFSLTHAEAMACGVQTIGPGKGGNREFMNEDNSWLVDLEPWQYIGNYPVNVYNIPRYLKWRPCDIDSISKNMRAVYDGNKKSCRIGLRFDDCKRQLEEGIEKCLNA